MRSFDDERAMSASEKKLILSLGVVFIAIIGFLFSLSFVSRGEVKAVTRMGAVTGRVLEPGPHLTLPWPIESTVTYNTKLVTYETSPEEKQKSSQSDYKDFPVDTNTSDGQQVDVSYTIRFSVDPSRAAWCAQNIGTETKLVENIVKTESRIWFRNIPRNYSAELLYTGEGSQKIQDEVARIIEPAFSDTCLRLDTVGVREIKFEGTYTNAISAKQVEAVKIETEKNKAEQEVFKAQQVVTAAEAQKKSQELQKESLTPLMIQKETLGVLRDTWNGAFPSTVVITEGSDGGLLLNLPVPSQTAPAQETPQK